MLSACCGALTIAMGIAGAGVCPSQADAVAVLVLNEAGVPANVIARAETDAAAIYRRLGVTVVWWNGAGDERRRPFTIKIVAGAPSSRDVRAHTLGLTPAAEGLNGRIAYAFYVPIHDFSEIHRIEVSVILGAVIAHELGHLLLPYGWHSRGGVMSGGWDKDLAISAAKGRLTFSAPESALIRNRVCREVAAIQARTASKP